MVILKTTYDSNKNRLRNGNENNYTIRHNKNVCDKLSSASLSKKYFSDSNQQN
jgi:hypothetical protein